MSTQICKTIGQGYATLALPDEVGSACIKCNNIFSKIDVLYMMNTDDGKTIQCNSKLCFEEQGGSIDIYQVNTLVSRKVIQPDKADNSLEQQVIELEPKTGTTLSEYDKFCTDNYSRIKAFREWIKKNDPVEAKNGQSLGLSLNQLNNQWIQEKIVNN